MLHLTHFTDFGLLFLRLMIALIYVDSGYEDLKNPTARGESIGVSKAFTMVLGVAEVLGGFAIILGVLQQFAAIALMLIMLGAIQKKIFAWKTGFWGTHGAGWYYELTLISTLFVILFTDGGRLVLLS